MGRGSVYVGKVWSTSTVVGTLWDKNQLITNNGYTAFDMFEIPNHLSQFAISSNGKMLYGNIKFFDKDKKYIKDVFNEPFVIPEGAKYCCGHFNSSYFPDAKIQLEEGTQATPYEPYIEDKLTILSPVQLEKVGDIADRIIEKDGVWGVEKNVVVDVLDDKNFTYNTYTSNTNIDLLLMNKREYHSQKVDVTQCILEGFKTSPNGLRDDISYINLVYENPANTVLIVDKGTNLTTAKQRVLGKKIYRILANPKFIPLPHDQQVKLRTFANKTNISFLTEIEGTIKAQVPKSIGATVNTHTEQINNLNKELDRVKKLEESTVSTVTTESDFTTVEATSNGYFEDVKLEGKTLANIVTTYDASKFSFKEAIKQEDGYYKLQYGATVNDTYVIPRYGVHLYKPNTTYTIIVDIKENTAGTLLGISAINSCIDTETISKRDFANLTGISTTTFKTRDDITISDKGVLPTYDLYFGIWKDGGDLSKYITFKYWVLEGDHTQNPPSFFEGLKSVGQDVDEISVSSCNGNYLNNDKFIEHIKNVASGVLDSQNKTITFSASNASKIHYKFNDLPNGSYILVIKGYNTDATQSSNITINYTDGTFDYVGSFVDGYAVREISKNKTLSEISGAWQIGSTVLYYDECYLIKSDNLDYTYKQDKKRLLYYNTETQTWEKPILREWDSIEKHANGKYYYHQRSGEVVLNGSENWSTNDGFSTGEYIACLNNSALPDKKQGVLNIISDKFNTKNCASIPVLEEGMWGEVGNSVLYMSISKSKLSTQDVEGFKQWLQTNNVTVVYQLAQEKVYECTNIDLITYNGETNYLVESGVLSPRTTLKVMANISNVVLELQRKASLLENDCLQMFKYMLAGDMVSVAYMLYPEDFETTNEEDNIEGIEEDNIEGIEEDNIEAVEEDNIEAVEEDNIEETVNDNTEEQ